MHEVQQGEGDAHDQSAERVLVHRTEHVGANEGDGREQVTEEDLRRVRPHATGGSHAGTILGRVSSHGDHGDVRHVREVPSRVRCDVEEHNQRRVNHDVIGDGSELEAVQERYDPREDDQPGSVTAPLERLQGVDEATVHPTQDSVDGRTDAGDRRRKGCTLNRAHVDERKIREEEHEIIRLNTGHQVEAEVADAVEELQRGGKRLVLLLLCRSCCLLSDCHLRGGLSFVTHAYPLSDMSATDTTYQMVNKSSLSSQVQLMLYFRHQIVHWCTILG